MRLLKLVLLSSNLVVGCTERKTPTINVVNEVEILERQDTLVLQNMKKKDSINKVQHSPKSKALKLEKKIFEQTKSTAMTNEERERYRLRCLMTEKDSKEFGLKMQQFKSITEKQKYYILVRDKYFKIDDSIRNTRKN